MGTKARSKLAEFRKQTGLTQAQLAVFVGVTTNTIQNWEQDNGLTQLEKYLKLGEILGLTNLNDLLEYVEVPENDEKPKSKGFSLKELRELRQRWGTDVTAKTEISSQTNTENKAPKEQKA